MEGKYDALISMLLSGEDSNLVQLQMSKLYLVSR